MAIFYQIKMILKIQTILKKIFEIDFLEFFSGYQKGKKKQQHRFTISGPLKNATTIPSIPTLGSTPRLKLIPQF